MGPKCFRRPWAALSEGWFALFSLLNHVQCLKVDPGYQLMMIAHPTSLLASYPDPSYSGFSCLFRTSTLYGHTSNDFTLISLLLSYPDLSFSGLVTFFETGTLYLFWISVNYVTTNIIMYNRIWSNLLTGQYYLYTYGSEFYWWKYNFKTFATC